MIKNIHDRITRLEKNVACYVTDVPDFNSPWEVLTEQATPMEIGMLIDNLKAQPIGADDSEVQKLAAAAGIPPQEAAEIINEVLILTWETVYHQKTSGDKN